MCQIGLALCWYRGLSQNSDEVNVDYNCSPVRAFKDKDFISPS